jgi:hypothetical protein
VKIKFRLIILLSMLFSGIPFGYAAAPGIPVQTEDAHSFKNVPDPDTPIELQKTWLRFHEDNLCEKVDAVFLFHENEMQVWTIYKDKKNYMKLVKLLQPLQKSYRITLYKMYLKADNKTEDIRIPPASLWENSKLSGYFRSSFLPPPVTVDQRMPSYSLSPGSQSYYRQSSPMLNMEIRSTNPTSSWVYRQRLVMFARETIEYARKIIQYSDNLVPLAQVAFDPAAKKELRRRALAICKKHAKKLQKYTEKLNDNLSKALPMASGKNTRAESIDKEIPANGSPFALAALLAGESKDLSNGVYRLIFPTDYSVTLEDLKNPPLIRSLEKMQGILARFRSIVGKASIV